MGCHVIAEPLVCELVRLEDGKPLLDTHGTVFAEQQRVVVIHHQAGILHATLHGGCGRQIQLWEGIGQLEESLEPLDEPSGVISRKPEVIRQALGCEDSQRQRLQALWGWRNGPRFAGERTPLPRREDRSAVGCCGRSDGPRESRNALCRHRERC